MVQCLFFECRNQVETGTLKCSFHRNRSQCKEPNCRNQAYARGHCVRHGARKYCLMDGCTHYRRAGGYCARHTTALRQQKLSIPPIQPASISPVPDQIYIKQEPLSIGKPVPFWLECIDMTTLNDLTQEGTYDRWDWSEVADLLHASCDLTSPILSISF